MDRAKGSAGTPAGVAESIRNGSGPAGFLLGEADVNITTGALVAAQLYGIHVPVLVLPGAVQMPLATSLFCRIDAAGRVTVAAEET